MYFATGALPQSMPGHCSRDLKQSEHTNVSQSPQASMSLDDSLHSMHESPWPSYMLAICYFQLGIGSGTGLATSNFSTTSESLPWENLLSCGTSLYLSTCSNLSQCAAEPLFVHLLPKAQFYFFFCGAASASFCFCAG